MRVILDAFGGDNSPVEAIKGAAQAVKESDVTVILCGDKEKIKKVMAEKKMTPMMDAAIFQRLLDVLPEALLAFNPCLSANSFHASYIFTFFGFPFFIAILTIAMS